MFKNISIKNKLILIIFISLVGLATILAVVVINKSQETQIKDKFEQLETIEFTKHAEINNYFTTLQDILTMTALNAHTKLAFGALKFSFNNIKNEATFDKVDLQKELELDYNINYLSKVDFDVTGVEQKHTTKTYLPKSLNSLIAQKIYILDNPVKVGEKNIMSNSIKYNFSYTRNHALYHNAFNNLLKTFDLYDIFLIDLNGNIIYSTFKEKDFATNLITGAYKDTGLSSVFKKALGLKESKIAFEDFKPYMPSYNVPASFISTPIYYEDKVIGVLAFQLPSEKLTNIMQFDKMYEKAGLGKTGEAYLVGNDYKMRTNSRFIDTFDDINIKRLNTTIGLKEIKTDSVKAVMNGDTKRQFHIIKDYRNKEVLSVYHIVHPFGKKDISWAIIAEIDKKEVLQPIQKIKDFMIITTLILVLLFLFISIFLIKNIINKPLISFQKSLEHFFLFLKGEEKQIKYLDIKTYDEIGIMSTSINEGIKDVKKNIDKENQLIWINNGIKKLNQQFIQSNEVHNITNETLEFLNTYISNINIGVIYLYNNESETLIQDALLAYTNDKKMYTLKEGIIGQVGYSKEEIIIIHNDNKSESLIQSATKIVSPNATYTFALVYNDILYGVIEIGSLINLNKTEIEFLRVASKSIAIALSTAIKNNEVKILLEKSNRSNKDLLVQQKKVEEVNLKIQQQQMQLEVSNTHLEEQQQQLEEANASMEEQQQKLEIQNKELHIAQKDVEKKAKDLELSNKYKTEFMANMSHELRTPLNAVILLSELMSNNKNKNLNIDDIKKANTINTAGKDLLRLIDDILDLSKVEAGKIDIIVDKFMPNSLLDELKNLYEYSAINKNITFEVIDNYKETIYSDKHRISQILKNLISNALKFTTKGNIDVSISKSDDMNLPIKISVKDTGIGIPQDKLDKIFEAFTQADGSTSRQYGGTGLGLSITKELTQLLGGKVLLESIEQEGSIFSILLPNITTENQNQNIESINTKKDEIINNIQTINNQDFNENIPEISIIDDIDLSDLNVLVVDDDIKNIFVLDGVLQDYDANVFTAYNGEEAIELLRVNKDIDIILMDIMMPIMDGFEAINIIHNNQETKDIPIIAVTAKTLKEDKEKCLQLGAVDYVSKPINMQGLINIIKVWSEKK